MRYEALPLPSPARGRGTPRSGRVRAVALMAALLLAAIAAPPLPAQEKRPSLDDELMKQLGGEPVEGVDEGLFGPEKEKTPAAKDADDMKQKLSRELGSAAMSEDDNPLLSIAQQMREVEGLIGRTQSGEPTQQAQDRIVAALDKLIEQARKNCSGASSPSSANQASQGSTPREKVEQPAPKPGENPGKRSDKPATTSNAPAGEAKVDKPDVEQIRAMIEKQLWGALPERQRQQLLQLPMEEFLPKYEPLIIEYFKRLSEEQGRTDSNGGRP